MLILLVLCGVVSALACGVLMRWGQGSARRYGAELPQRFHVGHVPRLGGMAMYFACVAGWIWMAVASRFGVEHAIPFDRGEVFTWTLVAGVAVTAGVIEDLTHRLPARMRFISTGLAALLGAMLFELNVTRLGLPPLDAAWVLVPWLGTMLAVMGLAGLPHAFNIIDGYNGLAGTVALVCCCSLGYVALQVGDRQLAAIALVLGAATAGFLLWNYPHGMIFAGDGGAYLWGVVIAIDVILLVQRHPRVSPWFPVLLLVYPVWETLFSIWRKWVRGLQPSVADALHFHQLIFRRVVRQVLNDDEKRRMLIRNNRTSPYLWGFTVLTVAPATLFWYSTPVLVACTVLFIAAYLWCYSSIVRFRAQRWMRRRRRPPVGG
jgi:UDP-GlcNAc:undecaprenyl-phosphate/decaprenyl-phosphate GlcNAc-1-phosphate transferase